MAGENQSPVYVPISAGDRLFQGEILANVVERVVSGSGEKLGAREIVHPFAVLVTQDCDLEQDHRARSKRNN